MAETCTLKIIGTVALLYFFSDVNICMLLHVCVHNIHHASFLVNPSLIYKKPLSALCLQIPLLTCSGYLPITNSSWTKAKEPARLTDSCCYFRRFRCHQLNRSVAQDIDDIAVMGHGNHLAASRHCAIYSETPVHHLGVC